MQIARKHHGVRTIVDHIGSAHDDAQLAVLMQIAKERIAAGQLAFDLDGLTSGSSMTAAPTVAGSTSRVLWEVLEGAYARLGFDSVDDDVFRSLVLARVVEPTSKADTIRVLGELGVPTPSLRTIWRTIARCVEHDWRDTVSRAAYAHATKGGSLSLVLYDVTTLYFEAEDEDNLRKVGMNKERRVDPQIVVGLLVTPNGFPLEVHAFTGNTAETTTLIPVLRSFQDRHGVKDIVVAADAGMLSAGNLNALEDAGFSFIVGSRISKAPYDLVEHFTLGAALHDGATLESKRIMGVGGNARDRRVVYHYSAKRDRRDNHTLDKQIERAQKVVDGSRPVKKDRFVKLTGTGRGIDQGLVNRARQVAGLKGYVTNIPAIRVSGYEVVAAYHELFQVERSFRMAKTDLRARPMFHHEHDSIQAHLTIVFTALAVARHLQETTGVSIRKLVRALRPLRDVNIRIAGNEITATTPPSPEATAILDVLSADAGH